jgi:hypothetical protein
VLHGLTPQSVTGLRPLITHEFYASAVSIPQHSRGQSVVVEAVGRVGNQLFAVAAGFVAARSTGRDLLVDLSPISGPQGSNRVEVLGFDWSFDQHIAFGDYPRTGITRHNFRGATRLQNAVSRLTGGGIPATLRSHESGHEPRVDESEPYGRLAGYFQSAAHVSRACELGFPRRLSVPMPGPWLTDLRQRAAGEDPLVVIVRLGDYRHRQHSLGLLGPGYFRCGLGLLDAQRSRRIWLFCDERDVGLQMLPPGDRARTWVVPQPAEVPKEQILLGASLGRDYVIANSTFAWWAAWMSGENSQVVAPSPWYRGRSAEGILPAQWTTIEAEWATEGP